MRLAQLAVAHGFRQRADSGAQRAAMAVDVGQDVVRAGLATSKTLRRAAIGRTAQRSTRCAQVCGRRLQHHVVSPGIGEALHSHGQSLSDSGTPSRKVGTDRQRWASLASGASISGSWKLRVVEKSDSITTEGHR